MSMHYRKLWETTFGPIPVDEDGRTYEIHHIDGNRSNNCIENLQCVSIKEHLEIHIKQQDWGACQSILMRLEQSHHDLANFAKSCQETLIQNNNHNFQKITKEKKKRDKHESWEIYKRQ